MRILLTGATGFVGQALCRHLHEQSHELLVVSRHPNEAAGTIGVPVTAHGSALEFENDTIDAMINLAGEPIFDKRWSEEQKQRLIDSRVEATRSLNELCQRLSTPPKVLISASAMGYYGDQGEREVTEETEPHDEFAHQLCRIWEKEALRLEEHGVRVAITRIGLVLDRDGGMLKPMLPMFRFGFGGKVGEGSQYMPWIHREDLVRAIDFLLTREDLAGAFNAGAPHPVTNETFTRTLADQLNRPALFTVPGSVIELALGEMSRLLLTGARMVPARLEAAGFTFRYPELDQALAQIVKRQR
ncbi:TIGR01777 family oxidoreductase [Kushneria phosphatilytica]|uniref:TIGR01777 family protein n=1 Tax=Kushneria phosphatilytica TaxID=657387 RepID=A0A1S1NW08_9GAMM|nr:TIGR01777 family oxidoreductase [Kushneria phosphatilytica]OHV11507.1 TIGR01777 family protein [Kushneria phosphatilytica]QEL12107.1 TIGR01777 family protein [Kushneria phosphatilytica]